MGHTVASVKIYNVDRSISKLVDLLADTCSMYTWIPRSMLEEISIKPTTVRNFRTIDGRVSKRQIGEVLIEVMNERATTVVVFAEKGDADVLGVHALEGLGLGMSICELA